MISDDEWKPYAMPLVKNDKLTMGTAYRRIDVNNYVIIYKVVEEAKQIRIFAVSTDRRM